MKVNSFDESEVPNEPPADAPRPTPRAGCASEPTDHSTEPTMSIYDEIADERAAQDKQWGGPDHDDTHIGADWREYRKKFEDRALLGYGAMRREALIKIAALAVAQIESEDRRAIRGN